MLRIFRRLEIQISPLGIYRFPGFDAELVVEYCIVNSTHKTRFVNNELLKDRSSESWRWNRNSTEVCSFSPEEGKDSVEFYIIVGVGSYGFVLTSQGRISRRSTVQWFLLFGHLFSLWVWIQKILKNTRKIKYRYCDKPKGSKTVIG